MIRVRCAGAQSANDIIKNLRAAVDELTRDAPGEDDRTIIIIRRTD